MDQRDGNTDGFGASQPAEPSPWDTYAEPPPPPAGAVPPPSDARTQRMPTVDPYAGRYEGTVAQPVAEPVVPVARAVVTPQRVVAAPVGAEPVYLADPEGRGPWIAIAAVVALLIGGLVGYLIGHNTRTTATISTAPSTTTVTGSSVDPATADAVDQQLSSIFTFLAAQARQPSGIQTPTQYPALDDLLVAIQSGAPATTSVATTSAASTDTSDLTAERDQLKAQVADLQQQLSDSQSALAAAQAATGDTTAAADQQAQIDQQAQKITTLQGQLDQAKSDLQSAQSDLDAANKQLSDLDPTPVDNVVGLDVAKVRSTASSNGWTLIEQPKSSTQPAGTVTAQNPAAGTMMIKGSVLYVEVATAPGSGG